MAKQDTATKDKPTTIGVRLQPASLERIDRWRQKQADAPTRAEAIRRLISEAFKTLS